MLQKEVIEAGQEIASNLFDAQISKSMGSMGGHVIKDIFEYDNCDLIQKYLDEEIVSVEAIYIAMKREEENRSSVRPQTDNVAMREIALILREVCHRIVDDKWKEINCDEMVHRMDAVVTQFQQ